MGVARSRGLAAEQLAAAYLELIGWSVEGRNVRVAGVEVDLVAREGRTAVLVEVKYRTRSDFGGPGAAIDAFKRTRLKRAALAASAGTRDVRIDVIALEPSAEGLVLRHVRNAVSD
jgi:putative endonuclease